MDTAWFAVCDVYGWGLELYCSPESVQRTVSALQTVISLVYSCCFCLLSFSPSLILFSAFHILHKGKMRKNKTNIWKLKHDREGRGWGGRGGGTEEGEAISENKRAFKSKGWKLVRLLFLKNDPCVVLLLRARYILFYLTAYPPKRGVLAWKKKQTNSAVVSFKSHNLMYFWQTYFKSLWVVSLISFVHYIER